MELTISDSLEREYFTQAKIPCLSEISRLKLHKTIKDLSFQQIIFILKHIKQKNNDDSLLKVG